MGPSGPVRHGIWYCSSTIRFVAVPRYADSEALPGALLKDSKTDSIAIEEVIETICGIRPERFPFEKIVALITFSVWLHWPDKLEIIQQGRLIAIAHLILVVEENGLSTGKKREATVQKIIDKAFHPLDTAAALVQRELDFSFFEQVELQFAQHGDVESIARFITTCPKQYKPSLNKALFFISEGGFADEKEDAGEPYKPSIATLKKSWVKYALQAPFILAEQFALEPAELTMLPPDDANSIFIARDLLKEKAKLSEYFGKARYIQEQLLLRLDKASKNRFSFVRFPVDIQSVPVDLPMLADWQLEIIAKYKAPKLFV
jgi:hypothetical protein